MATVGLPSHKTLRTGESPIEPHKLDPLGATPRSATYKGTTCTLVDNLRKGDITVLEVSLALIRRGYAVLFPVSDNLRYDLVFEDDFGFHRVQCKTAHVRDDVVMANCYSINNVTHERRKYQDQIDFFGLYCQELDKVYLVPIDDVSTYKCQLRLTEGQPNQHTPKYAKDYEFRA